MIEDIMKLTDGCVGHMDIFLIWHSIVVFMCLGLSLLSLSKMKDEGLLSESL